MKGNNIHILSKLEKDFLNKNYSFKLKDELILVTSGKQNQITAHPINKKFSIACKMCAIKISVYAMELWKNYFKDKYTLIDVQDAINKLIVSYQTPQKEDVEKMLKK